MHHREKALICKKKRIVPMLGIIVMGVSGCMSKQEVDQKALEKFEEKYGLDYEVVYNEVIDDSLENRDEIHVYVAPYMEEGESAIIYSWEEDNKAVSEDNLFGYIIRDEYEQSIMDIVGEKFPQAKIFSSFGAASCFDDSLTQYSTIEDAYELGENMVSDAYIYVVTDEEQEEFDQNCDWIGRQIQEQNYQLYYEIYPISQEDFDRITRVNFKELYNDVEILLEPYDGYPATQEG